ncbi:MAG: SPOR domain-containing protein [Sphingomonas sp.]|uniref:SPOR domain-containing protein n=1 Tax=Sphingomonas sp. TaxID=28214 RepID=UPI003F820297
MADTKAGVDAWNRGDYRAAVDEWRKAAIAGDADAQFNLGQAYKLGRGVPVDLPMAESWYRKAALQGHVQAEDNYGLALFQDGKRAEAAPWLEKSVARGEPRAELVLGTMLFNGDGVQRDWVRAYALMTRSSGAGLPQGSQTLAEMDKYIPADQRQQGVELARKMDAQVASNSNYTPEITGGGPAGPGGQTITPMDLPPSSAAGPGFGQPGATYPAPVKGKPGRNRPPVVAANPPRAYNPAPAYNSEEPPSAPGPAYTPPPVARPKPAPVRAEREPAAVPVASGGNWRVQFGAFRDEGNAKALWTRLKGQVAGLAGMQPYLRKVGAITKLQAGPIRSQADAARLCGAVKRAGSECVPVNP